MGIPINTSNEILNFLLEDTREFSNLLNNRNNIKINKRFSANLPVMEKSISDYKY